MPSRESSRRSFMSPKSPVPIQRKPYVPSTPSLPQAPTPVQQERPGFFSNIWQGFGLGTGQAIAHNMFRSDPMVKHEHISVPKEYDQCMKDNNNDKELCEQFLNK
jgi:hypothetical protein